MIGDAASRCGITSGSGAGVGNAAARAPRRAARPAASRRAATSGAAARARTSSSGPSAASVRQRLPDAGRQRAHRRVRHEGHGPRHGLVQDQRQRVDVGTPVDRLALGRLGRDVPGRPHHRPRRLGPRRLRQGTGHAEVGHPYPALLVEQQVRRLDITVHQPPDVRVGQPLRHLRPQLSRLRVREQRPHGRADRARSPRRDTRAPDTARPCPRPSRRPAARAGGSATPPSGPRPGSASRKASSEARAGWRTLTATWRCKDTSSARKTWADAPVPGRRASRYRFPRTRPMASVMSGHRSVLRLPIPGTHPVDASRTRSPGQPRPSPSSVSKRRRRPRSGCRGSRPSQLARTGRARPPPRRRSSWTRSRATCRPGPGSPPRPPRGVYPGTAPVTTTDLPGQRLGGRGRRRPRRPGPAAPPLPPGCSVVDPGGSQPRRGPAGWWAWPGTRRRCRR